jgi:hypothetical protein
MGKAETAEFARLYVAPGVDHVGSGAPANVDMLGLLSIGLRKARRRATSRSPNRKSRRPPSQPSGHCRFANGRPGRVTSPAR